MQTSLNKLFMVLAGLLILTVNTLAGAIVPAHAAATWGVVGAAGLSREAEWFTSIAVDNGTPYVAYQDWDQGNKATVMKFDGTDWVAVGTPGFSPRHANDTILALDGSTPYVAYLDGNDYNTATVMTFDGTDWLPVGDANFSPRYLHDLDFVIADGIPYVAYTGQLDGYKATVMKFDAVSGTWVRVGSSAFSAGEADAISLAVEGDVPYLAYSDYGDDSGKVTVMTFDPLSGDWVTVGPAGFSAGQADEVALAIHHGAPYVAYEDSASDGKATVMRFDGTTWGAVGVSGISTGTASQISLVFDQGAPSVAYRDGDQEGRATVMVFDGMSWNTVGAPGFSNEFIDYLAFAMDHGVPYVAYKDLQNEGKATVMKFIDRTPLVDVSIHGNPQGSYTLNANATQQSYEAMDDGVVKIASTNNAKFLGSEQVTYKLQGAPISFSEMLALPGSEVDTTYWLPWYNNVDLDTQLRFGNVSDSIATVNVYVGTTLLTPTAITLLPGESKRQSFEGVNNGPVRIESDQNIVASERSIFVDRVNRAPTSFSEMMALPAHRLDTVYWFPWYNNKDLDTQLRLGNASNVTAHVRVSIAGTEVTGSPFTVKTGESARLSFAGISAGPLKIESDQMIVASQRIVYRVRGHQPRLSELMALPENQVDTTYWLPSYANPALDAQLRVGNLADSTATIHVYVGGAEMAGSPFNLAPGKSVRQSLPNTAEGTVKVVSNRTIVVSERIIYKVHGAPANYAEVMGLPGQLLDTTYWLPWYNNVGLDTQLKFRVP